MGLTRKQYVVDKSFQYKVAIKAVILPLITIFIISAVLIYFAINNSNLISESNKHIDNVIATQDGIFSLIPDKIKFSDNPEVIVRVKPFTTNVKELNQVKKKSIIIVKNSTIVLYFLIAMTVIQTIIIFALSISLTHKISGPIFVMKRYLQEIKEGKIPNFRPLRQKDEFQDFYQDLQDAVEVLNTKSR